ncbi:MAG: hypothetical protein QOJ07_600, partial [Thermoleophilaceae bacterium]|nr:hypothetical protein [Thermoleophilaceae bacterium]
MPDDRFGDLGAPAEEDPPPERSGQTAAERFAELDEREPERKPKRPEPVRPSGRYTWVVGVAALIVIVLAGIRAASHSGGENVKGPAVGSIIAPFAAPSATGNLNGDANVKQRAGDGDSAGKRPACALPESVDVVNICDLRRSALVLTFITTRGAKCAPELDRVQHVADRHPEMQFAAVVSGNERKDVGKLVRQ